ncbi:MAG: hypothetical protein WBO24_12430 [Nitrospirales bacterium]
MEEGDLYAYAESLDLDVLRIGREFADRVPEQRVDRDVMSEWHSGVNGCIYR